MRDIEIASSAARTSTGNSAEVDTIRETNSHGDGPCRLNVDVTAIGGTPNMVLTVHGVYTRSDGTKIYVLLDTFTAKTAAGQQESRVITCCPRNIRVTWTITGGTPSITFSVTGNRT